MDDFDDADLDGDGEFLAIDISIMEDAGWENNKPQPGNQSTECCIPLIIAGASIIKKNLFCFWLFLHFVDLCNLFSENRLSNSK